MTAPTWHGKRAPTGLKLYPAWSSDPTPREDRAPPPTHHRLVLMMLIGGALFMLASWWLR
jgi:hypothetical protein